MSASTAGPDSSVPSNDDPAEIPAPAPAKRPFYRRIWFRVTAALALCAIIVFIAVTEWTIHHIEPLVRKKVIDTLSERFGAPVELDSLSISMFKTAGIGVLVEGHGLRIPYIAHGHGPHPAGTVLPDHAPLISVSTFRFHTSLRSLLRSPTHIDRTAVDGVEIFIPPPMDRNETIDAGNGPLPADPQHPHTKPKIALIFSRIDTTNAKLYIKGSDPNKDPLEFDIPEVHLSHAGEHTEMQYEAVLTNPKPLGLIHVSGHIGPWAGAAEPITDPQAPPPDPGMTPVDGNFTFDHADLSTIKGIGGILTGNGHFDGVLRRLAVEGDTDTPDFRLDIANHRVPLHTHYQAVVDGTTGDTYLNRVQAHLEHSDFTCVGQVVNVKGKGKDIHIDVDMPHARMEDMLRMAVRSPEPLMNGTLTLKAKMHIPPGKGISVTDKLQMQGAFQLAQVRFTDPKLQDRIDGLSERAQGHPEMAKDAGSDRTDQVRSHMSSNFTIGHGQITATDVVYEMPGATVLLNGVYTMDGRTFEFKGHARTEATASQMVGGWKGVLLKPVDRFFKKNGAGLQVPIEIHGTGAEGVHFGLAMHGADDSPAEIAHDMHDRAAEKRSVQRQDELMKDADREDKLAAQDPTVEGARRHHDRAVAERKQALDAANAITAHQDADEATRKAREAQKKAQKKAAKQPAETPDR